MHKKIHIVRIPFLFAIALAFLLGINGCSNKKNTFMSRFYHQMTTHYNYYFNAREIMQGDEAKLQENYKDNYDSLLPLFVFGSVADSKAMKPDMEKVIQKCSKAIALHSINVNHHEHNKWIDDCYFLIAKAEFYNRDYEKSLKTFNYIARAYKKQESHWNAMVWIIRIDKILGKKDKLTTMINYIESKSTFPKDIKWRYDAVRAQLSIDVGQYQDAIRRLKDAIPITKDRKKRERFLFVLAQLYELKSNYRKSTETYSKVIRMNPEYVMEFHARINQVKAFDVARGDTKKIKQKMLKMAKEKKNAEYRDQIYLALAKLEFREMHDSEGVQFLKQAAAASSSGSKYRFEAYYQLANIYYEKPQYVLASQYYDSTVQAMKSDNPKYFEVKEKDKNLKELVTNIQTVSREDSLQKIASMSKEDRKKLIKGLIKKAKEDAAKKQEEEANNAPNDYSQNGQGFQNNNSQAGNWYFYNPSLIGYGVGEFKKKWGNRPLADNWRRSDKSTISIVNNQPATPSDSSDTVQNPLFTEAYYLKALPLTDSALKISNGKIQDALYNEGRLYHEVFNDNENSISAFKTLLNRFDTTQYKLSTYYQLYRIYYTKKDMTNANYYKQKILSGYPFSKYAQLVKNPNYLKKTEEDKKRVENYYSIVYDLYNKKRYDVVITRCNASVKIFPDNHISRKFALLKALAIGQSQPLDSFKLALTTFIKDNPKTPEEKYATSILNDIKAGMGKHSSAPDTAKSIYSSQQLNTSPHRFVAVLPMKSANSNDIERDFSNFNSINYPTSKLKLTTMMLNSQYNLIIVQGFKNKAKAMDYYQTVQFNKKSLKELNSKHYPYFIIDNKNFIIFYKDKKTPTYISFFKKNYLNQK